MNYFVATYKTGITYSHCKDMDNYTLDQALKAMKEKYPTALSVTVTTSEQTMMFYVEDFWAKRRNEV